VAQRDKKRTGGEQPMEILSYLVKVVQDSVITIFWESVDRFRQEVKVRVELSLKSLISFFVVVVGMIFTLVGASLFLEELFGVRGLGYILTGVAVVSSGMYLGEKVRESEKKK
jgi:hypothetical protein